MSESVLIVAVPQAEPVVRRWREQYDSSAAAGVPAHVTLLYPFLPPDGINAADLVALASFFAAAAPFDVTFRECRRFETRILWIVPEPDAPFLALMRGLFERWPQCLPYHGTIPPMTVVPHLTVSDTIEGERLDGIERAVSSELPVMARVTEALLIENSSGRWTTRRRFPFG